MMTLRPNEPKIYLLGPGALGCAFATHLLPNHKVTLMGGQSDPRAFMWQGAPSSMDPKSLLQCDWISQTTISTSKNLIQQLKIFLTADSLFLFSFLPTGQEKVAFDTYHQISQHHKNCFLCLCSNGLAPEISLDKFSLDFPDRPVFRLLFYAGFGRDKVEKSLNHFGGSKVVVGDLMEKSNSLQILQSLLTNPRNDSDRWPAFKYTFSDSIRLDEIEKLFVNWTIAISAGPQLCTNLQASLQMDPVTLGAWAHFFELALAKHKPQLQPNSWPTEPLHIRFIRSFKETSTETAQNVNSFSKAFAEGNSSPFEELWSTVFGIRQALGVSRPADFTELDLSFERIAKTWRVSKFPWK
jgi:ketopantoate reductase